MSWQWQWLWWKHLGSQTTTAKLNIIAAYSEQGELIGLAPLSLRHVKYRAGLYGMRMETLASLWREDAAVFSEYLDFIVDRRHADAVVQRFEAALAEDSRWDDLVIAHTRSSGVAHRLRESALGAKSYLRALDPLEAHATAIVGNFDDYLKALDASTRRKLWNQRKKLAAPTITFASAADIGEYLDLIDGFLESRWGWRPMSGKSRSFHLAFAAAMAGDKSLRLSRLCVDDRPISVMYNVRRGGREYNLQTGIDLANNAGISPGYLHFGYSLENACGDGVREFDFLAGQGRARQYKQDFRTRSEQIVCLQFVRSRWLAMIYRAHDLLQRLRAGSRGSGERVDGEHARG